jgi:hypothetical protein
MNNRKIAAILITAFSFANAYGQKNSNADDKANGTPNSKQVEKKGNDSSDYRRHHVGQAPLSIEAVDTPVVKIVTTTNTENCQEKESNYPYCRIKQWFVDNKDLLSGIATIIAAIGVCISIFVARNTQSVGRRQLRAYLGISEFGLSTSCVMFTIKNYGLTPAKKVRIWCDCPDTERWPALIKWLPKHGISDGDLMWPGDTLDRKSVRVGLTEEFFANGKISYTDVFGNRQVTTFQYSIQKGPSGILRCVAHTKGNSAT